MRPSQAVAARLDAERNAIFPTGITKFIGVHVRNGDACSRVQQAKKQRTCDGLAAYVPDILRLSERYNVLDVFVATDGGPAILNATREYPQLRWHFRSTPQQKIDIDRVAIRRGAAFPYEEASRRQSGGMPVRLQKTTERCRCQGQGAPR